MLRWLKNGLDAVLSELGYRTEEEFARIDRFYSQWADDDRQDKERLVLALTRTDAVIVDLHEAHAEFKSLPPDAPLAMVMHVAAKQDRIIEGLARDADRRIKASQNARVRERDAQGRFISGPRGPL